MSDRAFIDMAEIARVECMWWVGGPGEPSKIDGDFMGIIFRPVGEQDYALKYRFRYYEDDEVFHSKDRKSEWNAKVPKDELSDGIRVIDEMVEKIVLPTFGGKVYRKRFVQGTRHDLERWLFAQPFAHKSTMDQWNKTRPQ